MSDGDYGRGLVTDREIEILHGNADVSNAYRNVVATTIRGRIKRLEDVELDALDQHESLADELREAVCEPTE